MKKPDVSVRLARLKAALPHAEGLNEVNSAELCKILGMTWRHLKANIIDQDAGFPVVKRGAEGHAWSFNVGDVLRYMIERDEAAIATAQDRERRISALAGISSADGSRPQDRTIGADEIRKAVQVLMMTTKLRKEQGELIEAEPVQRFFEEYHAWFQETVLSCLSRIDPAGTLPVAIRAAVENDLRNVLVELERRAQDFVRLTCSRSTLPN